MLLETLNQMRIRQRVNKAAKKNIVDNISVSHTKVEVYQIVPFINWFGGRLQLFKSEKLVATYYIGHETQDNMGSYVFREGDDEPYIVHIPGFRGYLGPRFEPVPELWRSHRIVDLPVTEIQSVKVEIPNQPQDPTSRRSRSRCCATARLSTFTVKAKKCPYSTPCAWDSCCRRL